MWFKVAFWFLNWRSRSLLMVVKNCQALEFFGVKQKNGEHFVHGIWNVWDVFDGESGKGTNSQWVFNAPIWAESLKSCTICSHHTCQIQTKKVLVFFFVLYHDVFWQDFVGRFGRFFVWICFIHGWHFKGWWSDLLRTQKVTNWITKTWLKCKPSFSVSSFSSSFPTSPGFCRNFLEYLLLTPKAKHSKQTQTR